VINLKDNNNFSKGIKALLNNRVFNVTAPETGDYKFIFKAGGIRVKRTISFYLEKNMLPQKPTPETTVPLLLEDRYSEAEKNMNNIYVKQQDIRSAELHRRLSFFFYIFM
jgi:hypothetical protein